jgi:hypothetical protein
MTDENFNKNFQQQFWDYSKPTPEIMNTALLNTALEEDVYGFIRYMCFFTHNRESGIAYEKLGFRLISSPTYFRSNLTNSFYTKILINDLTKQFTKIKLSRINRKVKKKIFTNFISYGKGINNSLAIENKRNNPEKYFQEVEFGLLESVIQLPYKTNTTQGTFYLSEITERNIAINLSRIFSNIGAILMVNHTDPMFNLSVTKLLKEESLYPDYKAAQWYFIDKDLPQDFIQFLTKLGAACKILPYEGKDADYVTTVIDDLTQLLASEK